MVDLACQEFTMHNEINTITAKSTQAFDLLLFAVSSSSARIALIRQDMKMAAKIVATTIMISTSRISKTSYINVGSQIIKFTGNDYGHLSFRGGGNNIPSPNIAGSRKWDTVIITGSRTSKYHRV